MYEVFAQFVALERYCSIDCESGPMLLLRVCRHWRALVTNSPGFWSSISTKQRHLYPRVAFVEQWLERSGPVYPLALQIELPAFTDRIRGIALMDLFLAHAHRWRELSLELDESLAERFLGLARGGAPRLEAVHLKMFSDSPLAPGVLDLLCSFERLTRLSLVLDGSISSLTSIPLERLTHIHLECNMGLEMWIALVGGCSRVVDLSVKGLDPSTAYVPIPEKPHVLRHLRNVTIDSRYNASKLLLYFNLPALESISLAFHFPGTLEYDLDILLKRSPFVKLALLNDHLTENALLACMTLESLNSVCELTLSSRHIGEETLRALTYSKKPGVEFLQSLEKLTLGRYTGTEASFVRMVTSRYRPVKTGLSRLKVLTILDKQSQHRESLGSLVEHGLMVL